MSDRSERHTPETGEALAVRKGADYVYELFTGTPEPKRTERRIEWVKGKMTSRRKMGRDCEHLEALHRDLISKLKAD